MSDKIKVGVRGIAGLLGKRLAREIQKQPDMELAFGIVRADRTLDMLMDGLHDSQWAARIPLFLDYSKDDPAESKLEAVKRRSAGRSFTFESANHMGNLREKCDVIVDAAAPGTRQKWDKVYAEFGKPVILQSGEYPHGRTLSPPLVEDGFGNIYRQGGCLASALSPVLAALQDHFTRVRINVLMQYDEKFHDFPTNQAINATYLPEFIARNNGRCTSEQILSNELNSLLGRSSESPHVTIEGILHVPSLDYYTATMHFDFKDPLRGKDIEAIFISTPRMSLATPNILSTFEVDHLMREQAQGLGRSLSPLVIYGRDLQFEDPRSTSVRIRTTIYSKMIAVLQNVDSIRILSNGTNPLESMRITDKYSGFN